MKDIIRKEKVFKSSVDKVWHAITRQDEISKWFIEADFKAKKGYEYTFTSSGENCTQIKGIVKHADPYVLIYSWIVSGSDVETDVKWELESTKEGTKLVLEHSGIASYPGDDAVTMFGHFDKGWDHCITELTKFVNG